MVISTYELSYRLLTADNVPHPIYDGAGEVGTEHRVTNTVVVLGGGDVTVNNGVPIRPAERLDAYGAYTLELRIIKFGAPTGEQVALILKPAAGVQLDPVNKLYRVRVTIGHDDLPGGSATPGNGLAMADQRLLHFNGSQFERPRSGYERG